MVTASPQERWAISQGDAVYTTDGYRLGEVVRATGQEIDVEGGMFFPRRYALSLAEIIGLENGVLRTSISLDEAKSREGR